MDSDQDQLRKPDQSSRVLYRRLAHFHPVVERGEGVYLWDNRGRRYIDASGGAAVVNIGHGIFEVAQAMMTQAVKAAYVHGTMFTTDALESYSQRLAGYVPIQDPRFYFMSSGSEAVETAIKFSRQVQMARGEASREVIISRWGSYHGATMGALAVTGKPKMRIPFAPLFRDQVHIPPPYCYRCPFGTSPSECSLECAQALEAEICRQGPERVAAFLAEPVGGATLGAVIPPEDYWPAITEICNRYGVLLISDEVMTGLGRTSRWFGIEHFGVQPDIITTGKGVTGGYFPFSVIAVRDADVETLRRAYGDFTHGGTFSHHAVGAAVAMAVLDYIETHELLSAAVKRGNYLEAALRTNLGDIPCVGDIRGLGMLWGVEFVADRETKAPFSPQVHFSQRVGDLAFEKGIIFYPGSGSVDGKRGDHLLIAPPFVIAEDEIDEVIAVLKRVVLDVMNELG